jgi:hypothetical protein
MFKPNNLLRLLPQLLRKVGWCSCGIGFHPSTVREVFSVKLLDSFRHRTINRGLGAFFARLKTNQTKSVSRKNCSTHFSEQSKNNKNNRHESSSAVEDVSLDKPWMERVGRKSCPSQFLGQLFGEKDVAQFRICIICPIRNMRVERVDVEIGGLSSGDR